MPVDAVPGVPGPIEGARQAVAYAGPAPALVAALKDSAGAGSRASWRTSWSARVPRPPEGATLVPVPLGRRRSRERGFNQSALLARELGRRWGLPVAEPLVRVREGADQRGARRERAGAAGGERVRRAARRGRARPAVAGGRRPHHRGDPGRCARALRAAGAPRSGAIAFARVPPEGAPL